MILKPSNLRKMFLYFVQGPKFYGKGGGSAPSQPTTTTQNVNSIPSYLKPYVQTMMTQATNQIYETDPNTGKVTGFKPYTPYSTDAGDYVAPFSPMQKQAQAGAANLQTPGQFAPASTMAGLSGLGSMTAGAQYAQQATNPNSVGAYMNPYLQQSLAPQLQLLNQQFGIKQAQQQGAATQAGAFGGSREALQGGLINQGQALAQQEMIGQGYNQAFNQAQQAQQFGANLGLQGYGQGIQAAGQLGQLGTQQLAADTSVLDTQGQFGAQQQAQQQQAIDQAVLNYQNAQQYPFMQLGTMSNLIRGIPTGNVTQTQYQAQPGIGSQLGGLAATGLGAYAAMKAEGGAIKDKGFKSGGIVGYNVGGDVEESMRSKLEDLDVPHLQTVVQNKESPKMASIAKEVLATRLAKGGIVAFADNKDKPKGSLVDDPSTIQSDAFKIADAQSSGEYKVQEQQRKLEETKAKKAAINLQTNALEAVSGIPVAKPVASTQAPVQTAGITPVQAATLGPMSTNESLKNMALNQAEGFKPPLQTSGIAAVKAPSVADKILAAQEENVAASEKEANKSVEERVKEIADLKEKMLGKDTETAEYRKSLMEEKANSKDELRRQMGMRLMEFGANWASTPGAPLVAGMKALKESLPSVMQDTKENKKLMKDIDKSIYLLNHSERLDAEGKIDAAAKARQDASGIVMANKTKLTDFAMEQYKIEENARLQEKQIEATLEGHRISAGAAVEAAKIRGAGGTTGYRAGQQITNTLAELKARFGDRPKFGAAKQAEWDKNAKPYFDQVKAIKEKAGVNYMEDDEDSDVSVGDTFVPTEEQKALLNKYSKKG